MLSNHKSTIAMFSTQFRRLFILEMNCILVNIQSNKTKVESQQQSSSIHINSLYIILIQPYLFSFNPIMQFYTNHAVLYHIFIQFYTIYTSSFMPYPYSFISYSHPVLCYICSCSFMPYIHPVLYHINIQFYIICMKFYIIYLSSFRP